MSEVKHAPVSNEAEAAARLYCVVSDEIDNGASLDEAVNAVAGRYGIDSDLVRQVYALVEEAAASVADDRGE